MRLLLRFLIIFPAFLAAAPLAAQPAAEDATPRVTIDALVAQALARSPEIAAAQHRYDAARARPVQERSLPDPMLSVGTTAPVVPGQAPASAPSRRRTSA